MDANVASAVQTVQMLRAHQLPDDQPCIEASSSTVNYEASFDTNFQDREGFVSGIAHYVEEAQNLGTLNDMLEQGRQYAGMLYTWRYISRGVPQASSDDQENRTEIYRITVDVLKPHIDKLKQFYLFQGSAVQRFCEEVKKLSNPEKLKSFVSETTKITLIKMIDLFATLNALKNAKSSVRNDCSLYRRAFGILNAGQPTNPEDADIERKLVFFLGTENCLCNDVVTEVRKIPHYLDVMHELADTCIRLLETDGYVLPDEKHTLLKAISFIVYIMDDPEEKIGIYKVKKYNHHKYDALFKETPVVPLYGDMHMQLLSFVQMGPHYDRAKWPQANEALSSEHIDTYHNITAQLPAFEAERDELVSLLALLSTKDVAGRLAVATTERASDVALRGLKTVSRWTTAIRELHGWKLANPTDKYLNRNCPADAEDYERAVRYNYSAEEKAAVVQIVTMIKDVLRILWKMESMLNLGIRVEIYKETQSFIQHNVRDMVRHCIKKKKAKARTVLMGLRNTCADWAAGFEPEDDPYMRGIKDTAYQPPEIGNRHCGPGSTQLFMMRTMLESLCADDKKKSLKHDLDSKFHGPMLTFYNSTKHYFHLLNFKSSLQEAADLSQLWFREFYLELSNGKHIQFPIDMSLPWILVDHVLTSQDPGMIEYALYPMDLYNDAGGFALRAFQKQYLYNEIEAEVDLCFDQFVYKLSENIFRHYRCKAASQVLDEEFKGDPALKSININQYNNDAHYPSLMRQRHFQLLGRSVNIHRLLSQRLNAKLKQAIDIAIGRFESMDLTGIIELELSLKVSRAMHEMLTQHLQLDPYEELLNEANNSVTSAYGRITLQVFAELCTDVIPNHCYNTADRRFIRPERAPVFGEGEPQRESAPRAAPEMRFGSKLLNTAYAAVTAKFTSFFGVEHLSSAVRLLEYRGVALCIEEMLKIVQANITDVLTPYVANLLDGMPKSCRLPLIDYGSVGAMGFYQLQLKDIMAYPDLQTEVFHSFREVGNSFIIFVLIEQVLSVLEVEETVLAMPFQGDVPCLVKGGGWCLKRRNGVLQRLRPVLQRIPLITTRMAHCDAAMAKQADVLTKERLYKGLSIFKSVTMTFKTMLESDATDHSLWFGAKAPNGVVDVDACTSFYRLWSAVQYTSLVSAASRGVDQITEFMGDGLYWAGAVIIALLGHRGLFETSDFSYHIIKAFDLDHKDESVSGVSVPMFVKFARKRRALNNAIFATMERYLFKSKNKAADPAYIPPPGCGIEV
ncbi:hypothetical protein PTSG_00038 [Salpingoeca rosetta]|uniref:CYRIA/CYRIB Rac1 binding domain-containing protein n=1 Tax=Salpingoeca rosetta (strain ATCC 50818 / BSB-021) TaxID=946362 RepID=F2TVC6_SALR5|nr:uncharacterized protein PTSG_00038 [Salpingoeca rosetta]EGD72022.1 hypothetical protein PTSG_00038 [Salpingoeca rosetta]|eukprot:XP_004998594.1 hypothetical protein PTSG_00038 [Salpingoeca rosetta]